MIKNTANKLPERPVQDADFANAEIALRRAADKARENAKKNGISIVVLENGVIREVQTDQL